MQINLSHLTAYDPNPVDSNIAEFDLMELAANMYNQFSQELGKMEAQFTVDGYLVNIPAGEQLLPREKHVPDEKRTTKWQKFATEHNINRRKRDRFVYDPKSGEERPRFGRGRTTANTKLHDPMIMVKDKRVKDAFEQERDDRKQRVAQNAERRAKNDKFNERQARTRARDDGAGRKKGK